MTESPTVSVIIPCFNYAEYVETAIESALTTIRAPHEVIVVDDGSTDASPAIIARYPGVRSIRQSNAGVAHARNRGLALAAGEFVVFLDADDWLLPGGIDRSVEELQARPDCMWLVARYVLAAEDGTILETSAPATRPNDTYAELLRLRRFSIGCPDSILFRRAVFDEVGPWAEDFSACADYELYLRVARRFPVCCHAHEAAAYRRHSGAMSSSPERMLAELARVWRAQRPYLRDRSGLRVAYHEGCLHWIGHYGPMTLSALRSDIRRRRVRPALRRATVLASVAPQWIASNVVRHRP
jgi:glycosyltransferase involved in cell wall biosynthesis